MAAPLFLSLQHTNRLYPISSRSRYHNGLHHRAGIKRPISIPMATQNRKKPHSRFICCLLYFSSLFIVCVSKGFTIPKRFFFPDASSHALRTWSSGSCCFLEPGTNWFTISGTISRIFCHAVPAALHLPAWPIRPEVTTPRWETSFLPFRRLRCFSSLPPWLTPPLRRSHLPEAE